MATALQSVYGAPDIGLKSQLRGAALCSLGADDAPRVTAAAAAAEGSGVTIIFAPPPGKHPLHSQITVFTARCYASAVLAIGLCLSICHKSEFY